MSGTADTHAYPTTKSGMASGMTTRTAHIRRKGTVVRSMTKAAEVPSTAHPKVTSTLNETVFQSSTAVRWRNSRRDISDQPA